MRGFRSKFNRARAIISTKPRSSGTLSCGRAEKSRPAWPRSESVRSKNMPTEMLLFLQLYLPPETEMEPAHLALRPTKPYAILRCSCGSLPVMQPKRPMNTPNTRMRRESAPCAIDSLTNRASSGTPAIFSLQSTSSSVGSVRFGSAQLSRHPGTADGIIHWNTSGRIPHPHRPASRGAPAWLRSPA